MASRSLGSLTIDLITKTGGFEQGMDRAARTAERKSREIEQASHRSAKNVQQIWSVAGSAIQGAIAGISVGAIFTAFIQETISAQNEQAQLAAVLRSTGEAAGYSAAQLNKMADSIESSTAFSAVEISEAQTTLLAFTGIVGEEFPRALQAAADMAARTGMTVRSAAETIGRALDVPSQGLASLSRQGFRFTDEQKALAQQLESTGRTAEAQGIVLRALEESYGGAAVAARDTLGGALLSLRNSFNGLITGSDESVQPLVDGINAISDVLGSGEAKAALEGVTQAVQALAIIMAGRLAVSATVTAASFTAATLEAVRYQVALARMAGVSTTAAAGITALAVAGRAAGAAFALLTGPVGAVVAIAATAAASIYSYRDSTEAAAASSQNLAEKTDWLNASLDGMTRNQAAAALLELQREYAGTQLRALDAESAVQRLTQMLAQYPNNEKAAAWREELVIQRGALDDVSISVQKLYGQIQTLNNIISAPTGIASLSDEYQKFESSIERQIALMGKSGQAAQLRYDLERGEMAKWSEDEKRLAAQRIGDLEQAEKAEETRRKASTGTRTQSNELENLIKQLNTQTETMGLTQAQAERYRIETASGTEADRNRALALYDQVQAWKEADAAIRQAAESSRYIEAINRELEIFQQQQNIEIAGIGMGDRQREEMERELSVQQEYAERRRQLEEAQQVESTRLSQEQYEARIQALQDAEDRQIAIMQESAEKKRLAEGDWTNGAARGLQNYIDEVSNVSASMEGLVTGAFGGMEDALVGFVKTGKIDFKSLADSIITDLIRIAVQQAALSIFTGGFGGMFGFRNGGAFPSSGVQAFASGGVFTNSITNSPTIAPMALFGEAGPEAIMPLERGRDGSLGVRAALPDMSMVGNQKNGLIVNLIENQNRAGQVEARTREDGTEEADIFVADIFGDGRRSRAIQQAFGLQRIGR